MDTSTFEVRHALPPKAERTWALFAHLSPVILFLGFPIGNILAPFVIWLMKKDEMPFVADQARESLNFQISVTIYLFISSVFLLIFVGILMLPVVLIADFVLLMIASVKANEGERYRYPFTIRFVK